MRYKSFHNDLPKPWDEISTTYAKMNSQFAETVDDVPFWHCEVSNTAMLASAMWQLGFVAACEQQVTKLHYTGLRGRPAAYDNARLDLYFSSETRGEWVEAKVVRVSPGGEPIKAMMRRVEARVIEAEAALRQITLFATKVEETASALVIGSVTLGSDHYGAEGRREARKSTLDSFCADLRSLCQERAGTTSAFFADIEDDAIEAVDGWRAAGVFLIRSGDPT